MKQAVVPAPFQIEYRQVPDPIPEARQVLLKITRIGICGSDVHVFEGKHPLVSFPLVQGHEFSGIVVQPGSDVEGFNPGDLVTVEPAIGCGVCSKCRQGWMAQCERLLFIGGALQGAGSQYYCVDARYAVKMPSGVDPDDAAMTEPLAVAVHSVRRVASISYKNVLILGGGTIGNLTAQVARLFGAGEVILVDRIPFRNSLAEHMGFRTIDPEGIPSVEDEILRMLDGEHPDVAFECVGKEAPLNTCIRSVARGGDVVVVGVYERAPQTEMILVQDKEINLSGSLMYSWDDFNVAVHLIHKKSVELKPLQTHHFPFDAWLDAYNLLAHHPDQAVKVIIDVS
jgi:L-iditol 2-dehydrogenase